MWIALIGAAFAAVTFERTLHKLESDPLPDRPGISDRSGYAAWARTLGRRSQYATMDAAVRRSAAAIDVCAGAPAAATVTFELSVAPDGTARVATKGAADPELTRCLTARFDRQPLGIPVREAAKLVYTLRRDRTPPVATPPAATPPASAGVDAETGFGLYGWGDALTGENITSVERRESTALYAREGDADTRWYGAPVRSLAYGFGAEGFYFATIGVTDDGTRVKAALQARYGAAQWDPRFSSWFWRGTEVLLQLRPGENGSTISWLHIPRAQRSGLAERLPGDKSSPTEAEDGRRMPKIFKE